MDFQVPEYIRTLVPYVPGKPIEETQREFNIKSVIKLASNENPLGPSLKTRKAIQAQLEQIHRYPDASGYRLKKKLSEYLGLEPQSIVLGNGSNEVIDFILRTYCVAGDAMVTHQGAFIAYKISAQINGVQTLEAKIDQDLNYDLDEVLHLVKSHPRIRVVFIGNPNNPTGTYLKHEALQRFMKKLSAIRNGSVLLVLDYAYYEYASAKDYSDPIPFLNQYSNLIIIRTFSKVYGLAGMRVGYGLGSKELISQLEKVRLPFNISSLGLVAAEAALSDIAYVQKSVRTNQIGMKYWETELEGLNVPFWKSQGNFILVNVQKGLGHTGVELNQLCLKQGVILRPVANYGLPHAIRISIGTPAENRRAIKVLEKIKGKK